MVQNRAPSAHTETTGSHALENIDSKNTGRVARKQAASAPTAQHQRIEKQLERLIALRAVLRAHAEQHRAALSQGNLHQRRAPLEIGLAQQPSGSQDVIVRIARYHAGLAARSDLPRRTILAPDRNV